MRQPSPTISYGPCYVDKWQNVWIGTDHGLSRLSTHTYYRFTSLDKITFSGEGNCLHAILQTRSGDWWMGGTNGLIHYAEGVRMQGAASEYQNVVWYKQNNPFGSSCSQPCAQDL